MWMRSKKKLINRGRHDFLKHFIDHVVENDIMYLQDPDTTNLYRYEFGQILTLFYNKFGVDIFFHKDFHKKFNDLSDLLDHCSLTDILIAYKKKLSEYSNSNE